MYLKKEPFLNLYVWYTESPTNAWTLDPVNH